MTTPTQHVEPLDPNSDKARCIAAAMSVLIADIKDNIAARRAAAEREAS